LILIGLESLVLSLFITIFICLSGYYYEYFISLFYLTIRVCERALGLSLLVLVIRTHGKDAILLFDNL